MIKAKSKNGDVILGLSDENVRRLTEGQPISFPVNELISGQSGNMIIIHGKTEEDMLQMFSNNKAPDEG